MILKESLIEKIIDAGLSGGADFAEVYAENTYTSEYTLMDSKPIEGIVGRLYGVGIRLFFGDEIIYTYSNDTTEKSLLALAKAAAIALPNKEMTSAKKLMAAHYENIHKYNKMPWDISVDTRIGYLYRADKSARAVSSDISQVQVAMLEKNKQVQIANSESLLTSETRNYCNLRVTSIAERAGTKETGTTRAGALATSEFFDGVNFEDKGKYASTQALKLLDADYAPAGEMPVVIDKGFGGVIFHEACGHGLETTSIAKGASVFCDKLGEKLADECVTAIDDGTISNEYGSLNIDDEGMPTQKTTLIEKGVLKSYIVDKMGAQQTGFERTGSGRRQDYRYAPASRMRNTFIAAGTSSLEEMIGDIDNGLYAKQMGGGSVMPGTGAYNFSVTEAYLIKNGQIDKQVKGPSLIGTGIETLGRISKVGSDLELSYGTCGSVSGMIPTTVGQPAIQVSKITVGGRA